MKVEEITVKSKDYGEFKYNLEQPETIAESVQKYGEKDSLEWLLAGRKAEINAAEWQKVRGTKTEEIEVNGKKFRLPKELISVVKEAMAKQPVAA